MNTQTPKTWINTAPTPYQLRDATHFPDWHGLIVLDAFFNNLTSGLMLASALAWAAGGALFGGLMPFAMTLALAILVFDLGLLVADLGDPLRFFHALRVMRPTSPLSVGVWGLTAYGTFLGIATALSWLLFALPDMGSLGLHILGALMRLCVIIAVISAIVVICYKGVVFSCTSQPGLCDARWLPPFMVADSLLMGLSILLALAVMLAPLPTAAIQLILPIIILTCVRCAAFGLLWQNVKNRARQVYGKENLYIAVIVYGLGGILPLILLFLGQFAMFLAVILLLCAGLFERNWVIGLPRPLSGKNPPDFAQRRN